MSGLRRPRRGLVAALAWKDLWHEWLLSLCLIIALAGVLAPALVLFGLKSGVITAMRAELVEDPVFREVAPKITRNYDDAFFARVRALPQTQFMVESVLRGASVLRVEVEGGKSHDLDMLPTGPGDPLLDENDTPVPAEGEAVLSSSAAEALGVGVGDVLTARVQRGERGAQRSGRQVLKIVGVLPLKADRVKRLYVPSAFALDVEAFREGFGVPARGWPGEANTAEPVYDGVIAALDVRLGPMEASQLTVNTGFFLVEEITPQAYETRFGQEPPDRPVLYDIRVIDRPAGAESVTRVRRSLSPYAPAIGPYVLPARLSVVTDAGAPRPVEVWSLPPGSVAPDAVVPGSDWGEMLPAPGTVVSFAVQGPAKTTDFPAVVAEAPFRLDPARTFMAVERLAVLRRSSERDLIYDAASGSFLLERPGYRGFRLYARSIDDVAALNAAIEAEGIETVTQLDAIVKIQVLDAGLSRLFWLIASLSFAAGALVLLASQYGAVERKKGALAHLRLIGLSRAAVGWFPMHQGVMIAGLGAVLGLVLAYLAQTVINTSFAVPLGFERRMCIISLPVAALAAGGMLLVSVAVSSLAAHRATRIDPAEGIRHE